MWTQHSTVLRSILAVAAGMAVFACTSMLRKYIQPLVGDTSVLAAGLTLAAFLIPGVVSGVLAPRAYLIHGALVGLCAAVFIVMQMNEFSRLDWSNALLYRTFSELGLLGACLCAIGSLIGHALVSRRLSSNNLLDRTRER
jgi:hypothetical protein